MELVLRKTTEKELDLSIKRFFDRTVTAQKLKTVSGNKKRFQTTATADCHIQALDRQAKQQMGIVEDKAWVVYFDIDQEYIPATGDQITDDDGVVYKVIDVTKKDYSFGINQHIEVIMTEYNA